MNSASHLCFRGLHTESQNHSWRGPTRITESKSWSHTAHIKCNPMLRILYKCFFNTFGPDAVNTALRILFQCSI